MTHKRSDLPSTPAPLMRKSPHQARAALTIEIIFEAAAQILQVDGLAGLTTNRVAEHAGYSVGTLYQYFKNKESLLLAMAMHEADGVARTLDALFDAASQQTPEDTLRATVRIWINFFGGRQQVQRLVMQAVIDNPEYAQFHKRVIELADQLSHRLAQLPASYPLTESRKFVLSRALVGIVRSGVLESSPLLHEQPLQEDLVWLLRTMLYAQCETCHIANCTPCAKGSERE